MPQCLLYYHSVSGGGIDKRESQCKQKLELMKIMICWNRSWMYNCPVYAGIQQSTKCLQTKCLQTKCRRRNVRRRIVVEPFTGSLGRFVNKKAYQKRSERRYEDATNRICRMNVQNYFHFCGPCEVRLTDLPLDLCYRTLFQRRSNR